MLEGDPLVFPTEESFTIKVQRTRLDGAWVVPQHLPTRNCRRDKIV